MFNFSVFDQNIIFGQNGSCYLHLLDCAEFDLTLISPALDIKCTFCSNLMQKTKLFRMKFGTQTDSNTLNLIVMFKFSLLDRKYLFRVNLVKKYTIDC